MLTQLRRYGVAGIVNTLLGYAVISALMVLSVSALVANVAGYAVARVLAFVLNRQWVFEAAGNLSGQARVIRYSFLHFPGSLFFAARWLISLNE